MKAVRITQWCSIILRACQACQPACQVFTLGPRHNWKNQVSLHYLLQDRFCSNDEMGDHHNSGNVLAAGKNDPVDNCVQGLSFLLTGKNHIGDILCSGK